MKQNRWDATCVILAFGTVLMVTMASAQTYSVLYNFDGVHGQSPSYPNNLIQGIDGNLYGMTASGGTNESGVLFGMTPDGQFHVLYNFDGVHGSTPGGLSLGSAGVIYGVAESGGAHNYGTLFGITPAGQVSLFYNFLGCAEGGYPMTAPIEVSNGTFYGTTLEGCQNEWSGSAYKLDTAGHFTSFGPIIVGGGTFAPFVQAGGYLYSTTVFGGGDGSAFRMSPDGTMTTIYSFCQHGCSGGAQPSGPLIVGNDNYLYGTTPTGGNQSGEGVVFKLSPSGDETVLHSFTGGDDGGEPISGVMLASDRNYYGITLKSGQFGYCGIVYRITPKSNFSTVFTFDCSQSGSSTVLMQHTNGLLYGMTSYGGLYYPNGVIYSLDLGLPPFVRLTQGTGRPGSSGGILGQGFIGTTSVTFNGVPAKFTVVSDTFIEAVVPADATTGYVTVTTTSGVLNSNAVFRVIQ